MGSGTSALSSTRLSANRTLFNAGPVVASPTRLAAERRQAFPSSVFLISPSTRIRHSSVWPCARQRSDVPCAMKSLCLVVSVGFFDRPDHAEPPVKVYHDAARRLEAESQQPCLRASRIELVRSFQNRVFEPHAFTETCQRRAKLAHLESPEWRESVCSCHAGANHLSGMMYHPRFQTWASISAL